MSIMGLAISVLAPFLSWRSSGSRGPEKTEKFFRANDDYYFSIGLELGIFCLYKAC